MLHLCLLGLLQQCKVPEFCIDAGPHKRFMPIILRRSLIVFVEVMVGDGAVLKFILVLLEV